MDSIKDVVRSSVKVPEFNKHLKKAGGHIGRNVVEITINEDNSSKTLNKNHIYLFVFMPSWKFPLFTIFLQLPFK